MKTSPCGSNMSRAVDFLQPPKPTWMSWWKSSSTTCLAIVSLMGLIKTRGRKFQHWRGNSWSIVWWWLYSLIDIAKAIISLRNMSSMGTITHRISQSTSQLLETRCTSTARKLKTDISPTHLSHSCLQCSHFVMKVLNLLKTRRTMLETKRNLIGFFKS